MRVSVERRRGWGLFAACALVLAALASACETDSDGFVFEDESSSGDGGSEASAGGSKGGATSAGRGGNGAGAATTGGRAEGGGGEPTPDGGSGGSLAPPSGAGEAGAPAPGTGGSGGMSTEPTAGSGGGTGDSEPPTLIGTHPTSGASDVPEGSAIRAQFSEELDDATVTEDSFVVTVNGDAVGGELDIGGDIVTFIPAVRMPLLAKVTITLGAEITDRAGNALADAPHEWSFQLSDGVWHPGGPSLGNGNGPQAAIDETRAVVGWTDSNQLIWAAASDDQNGFSAPVSVTASSAPSDLQLGSVGGGAAIAVWVEHPRIRSSKFTPGSGWSLPVYIDQNGAESASGLELATSESGFAVASWISSTDGGAARSVWGNRFASNAWGTASTVDSSTTESYAGELSVSISDSGLAVTLGTRQGEEFHTIWASSRSAGSWSTPATLETVTRRNPNASNELTSISQRAISVANNGQMLAVWTLYTSGRGSNPPVETRFMRSSTTGTWGEFESFGDRRGGLWLAGNGSGEVLAAFNYSASMDLVPMRYTPTNGWSALAPFQGTSGVNGGAYVDIAIDEAGNGLLAWDPLESPRAARYVADGAGAQWSTPPTELGARSSGVSLAVSRKRGAGVVTWADGGGIYARIFDFQD